VDASVIVLQVIGGFTLGAIIGYTLRVLGKIALIVTGLSLLPVVILWRLGVLYVDWNALNRLIVEFAMWISGQVKSIEEGLAGAGVFGLSTLAGFIFGLVAGFRHIITQHSGMQFIKAKRFVREKR
jgi:uncharacterized membrane protein (Fun14 family)